MRILSMGAGVQTTAVLIKFWKRYDYVVFADTGDEHRYTYDYIERYLKPFCVDKGVPFVEIMPAKGKALLDYCVDGRLMPTRMNRFCTRIYKIDPIRRFLKWKGATRKNPALMDMGISLDESHRVNEGGKYEVQYVKKQYPLIDERITRQGCLNIIRNQKWPPPGKSGCDYCPFMGKRMARRLAREDPARFERALQMEEGAKNFPQYTLFDGITMREIRAREMANATLDGFVEEEDMGCDSGHCLV